VDDILLASNDIALLHETKSSLPKNFEIKDLGDASFVIGFQIQRDRTCRILGSSQNAYINKVLDRYAMKNCSPGDTLVTKGDGLTLLQYSKNDIHKEQMKDIPYVIAVESLMYAQVCTHSDVAYVVGKLDRYLCNFETDHWKTAKKVM